MVCGVWFIRVLSTIDPGGPGGPPVCCGVFVYERHNEGRFPDSLVCTVLLIQLVLMADEALCT